MANKVVLLTAAAYPGDARHTLNRNSADRLREYSSALRYYAEQRPHCDFVICDSTGYNFAPIVNALPGGGRFEALYFDGADTAAQKGKGCAELDLIAFAMRHSTLIQRADQVLKITGRYTLRNIKSIVDALAPECSGVVYGHWRQNLSWFDSRVFCFPPAFFSDCVIPRRPMVNDYSSVYFEQVLSLAVHEYMSRGGRWGLFRHTPVLAGRGGTRGNSFASSGVGLMGKRLMFAGLRRLLDK